MAIKGKKKHKSGGRPKAVAPKREVVIPKDPLLERKSFLISMAAIVALILGLGLGYGFGKQEVDGASSAAESARKAAAARLQTGVDQALVTAGQASETGFDAFPEFTTALEAAQKGDDSGKVVNDAEATAKNAHVTATALFAIKMDEITKGMPPADVSELTAVRDLLGQGVILYAQAGDSLVRALRAPEADRKVLLSATDDLRASAASVFGGAYQRYAEILLGTGVVEAAPPPDQVPIDATDLLPPEGGGPPQFPQPELPVDPGTAPAEGT